ncbi:NAD-dependent epimerase/dehydratase family protein [Dactylosporangium sp. CA-139066]|uniref:NAD-dependent epimerase/dehydratase family protein n=1 Tax=Dactylosporangium sp. CA-139066 TaxID=3239930 RepID=UPI003D8C1EA6
MDVFITGASGYVGGVVTGRLLAAGHRVAALARSDRAAERVSALGAAPVRGDLRDAAALREAAGRADAVVHAAVDYADPAMAEAEAVALRAMLGTIPFVYTSTGLVYGGGAASEDDPVDEATSAQPHKVAGERIALAAGGTVLRVPLVHGRDGSALIQGLLAMGRTRGMVPYIGEGTQTWAAVHVDDLADLFLLALEKPQPGGVFNAAPGDTFQMRRLAEALALRAGAAAVSLSLDEVAGVAPQLAVLARDGAMDGARARSAFGWAPHRPALLDDVRGAVS